MNQTKRWMFACCLCCLAVFSARGVLADAYTIRLVGTQLLCYRGGEVTNTLSMGDTRSLSVLSGEGGNTVLQITDGEGDAQTLTLHAERIALQGRFELLLLEAGVTIPVALGENAQIDTLSLQSNGQVTVTGGSRIDRVSVQGRAGLTFESGSMADKVICEEEYAHITVRRGASVERLYADDSTRVQGEGDIRSIAALADQPEDGVIAEVDMPEGDTVGPQPTPVQEEPTEEATIPDPATSESADDAAFPELDNE